MFEDGNLFLFGLFFWLVSIALIFSFFRFQQSEHSYHNEQSTTDNLEDIQQQCQRLREELKQQSQRLKLDLQNETIEELQTLLISYPTACKMAEIKPYLPAKNLVALFTPLENLLHNWGYETIGKPWEKVTYNPQLHQIDNDEISEGELVYIRFVGYRQGERIIFPAKVSDTLPEIVNGE